MQKSSHFICLGRFDFSDEATKRKVICDEKERRMSHNFTNEIFSIKRSVLRRSSTPISAIQWNSIMRLGKISELQVSQKWTKKNSENVKKLKLLRETTPPSAKMHDKLVVIFQAIKYEKHLFGNKCWVSTFK